MPPAPPVPPPPPPAFIVPLLTKVTATLPSTCKALPPAAPAAPPAPSILPSFVIVIVPAPVLSILSAGLAVLVAPTVIDELITICFG